MSQPPHNHVATITLLPKNPDETPHHLELNLLFDRGTGKILNEDVNDLFKRYFYPKGGDPVHCTLCGELIEYTDFYDKYCNANGYHQISNSELINIGSIKTNSRRAWFLRPSVVTIGMDGQILSKGYMRKDYELINDRVRCIKCYRPIKLRELTLADRMHIPCSLL